MIHVALTDVLESLAERRRDFPLHGDSMDYVARDQIAKAIPPGLRVPGPGDPTRQRTATGGAELAQTHPVGDLRSEYMALYRQLCEGA